MRDMKTAAKWLDGWGRWIRKHHANMKMTTDKDMRKAHLAYIRLIQKDARK